MAREEWRDIPGLPGYSVSNRGRVRGKRGHLLKFGFSGPMRYFSFGARDPERRISIGRVVHRAVLAAFVGPLPTKHESRHLDGNRYNNRLENLTYGTVSDNRADQRRHGTLTLGSRNGMAKLRKCDVRRIRRVYRGRYRGGPSQDELAAQLGVSQQTISAVVRRARYSD